MKKPITLLLAFILTIPMFIAVLPKAEVSADSVSSFVAMEPITCSCKSGPDVAEVPLSHNLPSFTSNDSVPHGTLTNEVYVNMAMTFTEDNQYDFDSTVVLVLYVDAYPGPRAIDAMAILETPNNDIAATTTTVRNWIVTGIGNGPQYFYLYLGLYVYQQYVGLSWHVAIQLSDSSTHLVLDQKNVPVTIGPILYDHFLCKDPANPDATKTATFYDSDTMACHYTRWDTHNLHITYSVKFDFYGPSGLHTLSDPVSIWAGGYYYAWAGLLIRGYPPATNPGGWYSNILLEDRLRNQDTFVVIATTTGITVDPSGGRIYVDSTPITTLTVFQWTSGSSHTLDPDSTYSPSDGRRLIFTQWNDGNTADPRPITVSGSTTYQAQWRTQYRLTITANPSGGGTTNPTANVYWLDSGTTQPVSETPNSGYSFNHWDLDSQNVGSGTSYSVTMNTLHVLTAVFTALVKDFSVSLNQPSLSIDQGKSNSMTVTVQQVNGYSYDVSLTAYNQPAGVTITFNPAHGVPLYYSTMNIQVSYTVAPSTYAIGVRGTGSDPEHKVREITFQLTVNRITFTNDPRLQVGESSYSTPVLGITISLKMYGIEPSGSHSEYRSALQQHFGISLSGDFTTEAMFLIEVYGLYDLVYYLNHQWYSSWMITSDYVSYVYSQQESDGGIRLGAVWRNSIDFQTLTTSVICTIKDLSKLLTGVDIGAIRATLGDIIDVLASIPIEFSIYRVFSMTPQNTYILLNFSTVALAEWAQNTSDFLAKADVYISLINVGLDLALLLTSVVDPAALVGWVARTVIGVVDTLMGLYSDYIPEVIVNVVHILATWVDPPGLVGDAQIFSQNGDLVLGWNSTTDDFTDYSSAGFVLRDGYTQVIFVRKSDPLRVGIASHGSVQGELPYTLSIYDDYGNQSYASTGFLSTNQTASIDMTFPENITTFVNQLGMSVAASNLTPAQGLHVTIDISVGDTFGMRDDANVTLLINNSTWIIADNLEDGQYRATIDTIDCSGLTPVTVYANCPNMTVAYYAMILNVSSAIFDMAVAALSVPKNYVGQGYNATILLTVENLGSLDQNFTARVYANSSIIDVKTLTIAHGDSTILRLDWSTDISYQGSYTFSAQIDTVPGETNTTNNNIINGSVLVTLPGNLNGDDEIDIYDAVILSNSFNTAPIKNINADINNDDIVDIYDAIILANHYNQHYP